MKYSKANPPISCIQKNSTCYKQTRKMNVLGILWHSTGANNPRLSRYVQPSDDDPNKTSLLSLLGKNAYNTDYNHSEQNSGLNAFIGKCADGSVTTVQTMPWDYRPWGCGAGTKGSCNNGWIQFEICEDALQDKEYASTVFEEACQLTAYLCQLFGVDPLGYSTLLGVKIPTITCHADAHALGFGSNHGDINHWFPKLLGKSMKDVRDRVASLLSTAAPPASVDDSLTNIMGESLATESQMVAYVSKANHGVDNKVLSLPAIYIKEANREGVRADIAFAQSCLETGNFSFEGSAVTLDQNNFCGMGVTSTGERGDSFKLPDVGIRAQVQHLKAYATTKDLEQECVDPRFKFVTRGSAPYVEWLGQKENPNGKGWATGMGYGKKILAILADIMSMPTDNSDEEEDDMKRYNSIAELPGYAKNTIIKMVDKGLLGGVGIGEKDKDGRPTDLNLSEDMLRVFVVNDRAGAYGE